MREQLPWKQTNNAYDAEQYEKCQGEDIFYPKNIEERKYQNWKNRKKHPSKQYRSEERKFNTAFVHGISKELK